MPHRSQHAAEWKANIRAAEAAGENIHDESDRTVMRHAPPSVAVLREKPPEP